MLDEIIAPLLTTGWGRRAGWGVMIVTSLLLIYSCFQMVSHWRHDFGLLRVQTIAQTSSIPVDETNKLIAQIPEQHIFGKSGMLAQGAAVPVTSLQLRLVGVIKSDPEKFSRVIISESSQPAKVYQVGDTLSSGVRIYSITRDGVILDNGGHLEKLPLSRPPLLFQGMPKSLLEKEGNE